MQRRARDTKQCDLGILNGEVGRNTDGFRNRYSEEENKRSSKKKKLGTMNKK